MNYTYGEIEFLFDRAKADNPAMTARLDKAQSLLEAHLNSPKARLIIAVVNNGELVGWRVKSQTMPGVYYNLPADGHTCDCPARKCCYHILSVRALARMIAA